MLRKSKYFYAGLNLIAPGIGQFALKSYVRALVMLSGGLFFLSYSCFIAIYPLYKNIKIMLEGQNENFVQPDFKKFLAYLLVGIAIWFWSFLDIFLRENPNVEKNATNTCYAKNEN